MLSKALPKSFAFTHAVMLSTQEKKNIPSDVFSEFRNASGCLGEQDMLWKQKPMGDCFHSIFKFSQTYVSVSIYIV